MNCNLCNNICDDHLCIECFIEKTHELGKYEYTCSLSLDKIVICGMTCVGNIYEYK